MKKLPEKIIRTQSQACKVVLNNLLFKVFIEKRPADKVLSDFFRQNRKFGSRDRKLILELSFAFFRWWGWLKKLLPREVVRQIKFFKGEIEEFNINDKYLARLLLGAAVLDDLDSVPIEMLEFWSKESDIKYFPGLFKNKNDGSLKEAIANFKKLNGSGMKCMNLKVSVEELIPECANELFASGTNISKLIEYFQLRPPMWLRAQTSDPYILLNSFKKVGMDACLSEKVNGAIYVNKPKINLYTLDEFKKGLFEVQDLASQAIGLACNPKSGERWWDACAGAGGKSLQLSFLMKGKGSVTASDIREYKLDDLKRRAKRARISNIRCSGWNGKPLKFRKRETFDGVLVDAPCSCSGTWRRNPDAKWNITSEGVNEISLIQRKVLANAAGGVKVGGMLVYATCSIFEKENSDVAKEFLKENENFKLEPFKHPITGEENNGMLQVYPWDGNCDATFIAKFKKIK